MVNTIRDCDKHLYELSLYELEFNNIFISQMLNVNTILFAIKRNSIPFHVIEKNTDLMYEPLARIGIDTIKLINILNFNKNRNIGVHNEIFSIFLFRFFH